MKKTLESFINEIVLGLFGIVVVLFNVINDGSLEVNVVGGLMILAAVIDIIVTVLDKVSVKKASKPAKK